MKPIRINPIELSGFALIERKALHWGKIHAGLFITLNPVLSSLTFLLIFCGINGIFTVGVIRGQVQLPESDISDTVSSYRSDNPSDRVKLFRAKMPSPVTDPAVRDEVLRKLPATVLKLQIENKELSEKFRQIISPVLEIYGREKIYDFVVFKHETPVLFSDTGVVLVVSTGMIERAASDDELMGYTAHEIAHEYFARYSIFSRHLLRLIVDNGKEAALSKKISQTLAIIELQCDIFSALTLAGLNYDPLAFIRGIENIGRDFPAHGVGFHPPDAVRRKVVEQIVEQIVSPTFTRPEPRVSKNLKEMKELVKKEYEKPGEPAIRKL